MYEDEWDYKNLEIMFMLNDFDLDNRNRGDVVDWWAMNFETAETRSQRLYIFMFFPKLYPESMVVTI